MKMHTNPVAWLDSILPAPASDVPRLRDRIMGHARTGEWNAARLLASDLDWAMPARPLLEVLTDLNSTRDAAFDFAAAAGADEACDLLDVVWDDLSALPIAADAFESMEGMLASMPWHKKAHLPGVVRLLRDIHARLREL
jgi:hypothetical protein